MFKLTLLFTAFFILICAPAHAYIGPGMGGGIIAATLGVVVAIFAALFGVVYFPIKRFFKNRNQKKTDN
jgi:O-antigen/teichoic acid export membrane protein